MSIDNRSGWISLIGFTSTGKTTIGKIIAKTLSIPFKDLDSEAELLFFQKTGVKKSCREIFVEFGADFFSQIEFEAVLELSKIPNLVVATGGAAPLNRKISDILTKNGKVIYLYATPKIIFARMAKKGLPAYLRDDPTIENLTRHWQKRDPIYRSAANVVLSTDKLSPKASASLVVTELNRPKI